MQGDIRVEIQPEPTSPNIVEVGPPQSLAGSGNQASQTNELNKSVDIINQLPPEPNGWALSAAGAGAPGAETAPAPGFAPSASQLFVAPHSQRQLTREEEESIRRQRGPRLPEETRRNLNPKELFMVELYERLSGVPFCVRDLPLLGQALDILPLRLLRRDIEACAKFPGTNPGAFIVRDGMKHVLSKAKETQKLLPKNRIRPYSEARDNPQKRAGK
jgi:hypothetical protein